MKPSVLFVDDEAPVRETWKYLYGDLFRCTFASNGTEALQFLHHPPEGRPFDVLVTDQRMPGMSGVQLCRKARLVSPKTARIILTAFDDPEVRLCPCRRLEKPPEDGKLEKVVHEAIVGASVSSDEAREKESRAEAAHQAARKNFREATAKLLSWEPPALEEVET